MIERLRKYSQITYGASAYELSVAEASLLIQLLECNSVFEVWKNSPCGDIPFGMYATRDEAIKHRDELNRSVRSIMDKAEITEHRVLVKYEKEDSKNG